MKARLTKADLKRIDGLVLAFESQQDKVSLFLNQLVVAIGESQTLHPHIHSIRYRVKDPNHLRDKLSRKFLRTKEDGLAFDITPENLVARINDLAGVRILHLYTKQIEAIDKALRGIFEEQQYALLEGPFARTWDDESRAFFQGCGIETQQSPSMYTSVHYIVGSASRTRVTCEIQVRTLMEEVWGEVDHTINYPHPVESLPCREQLKVLARVTSSATRLVDSIFATLEHSRPEPKTQPAATPVRTGTRSSPSKQGRKPKRQR